MKRVVCVVPDIVSVGSGALFRRLFSAVVVAAVVVLKIVSQNVKELLAFPAFTVLLSLASNVWAVDTVCTFDEAYDPVLGFSAPSLSKVTKLSPPEGGAEWFDEEKRTAFLDSETLTSLRSVDFSNMNIDDTFINYFSLNPTFSRINTICLSGNADITVLSLELIRDSDYLGSLRELPQISGRYGFPGVTIDVKVDGTGIRRTDAFEDHRFFSPISYRTIIGNKMKAPSVRGVKVLHIEY